MNHTKRSLKIGAIVTTVLAVAIIYGCTADKKTAEPTIKVDQFGNKVNQYGAIVDDKGNPVLNLNTATDEHAAPTTTADHTAHTGDQPKVEADIDHTKLKSIFDGLDAEANIYNVNFDMADHAEGKLEAITAHVDNEHGVKDAEGHVIPELGVVMINGKDKVESKIDKSMVLVEKGIVNVLPIYLKNQKLPDNVSDEFAKGLFKNTDKPLLIVTQASNGRPLAAYAVSNVSYFNTGFEQSIGFKVDGKSIFVYNGKAKVYDKASLK